MCGEEKSLSEFYTYRDSRTGKTYYTSKCKRCKIQSVSERRRPGIERRRAERTQNIDAMLRSKTKTCRVCGRVLPKSEFNKDKNYVDGLNTRCRQCSMEAQRKWRANKPRPKVTMHADGRLYNSGIHSTLYWTPQMTSDLKRYYPSSSNREVSELLGINRDLIGAKAKELGLTKSPDYLIKLNKERGFLAKISRKRNKRLNASTYLKNQQ